MTVVVTDDYQVISLAGVSPFQQEQLTKTEWIQFLTKAGVQSDMNYDIVFCQESDYWLVIGIPESLAVQFMIVTSSDSNHSDIALLILGIVIGSYILLLCSGGAIYSHILSKKVTRPVEELARQAKKLEQSHYVVQNSVGMIEELQWLQDD